MKPALLVVDPQNDFFGTDNPSLNEFLRVIPNNNKAISIFRKYKLPIIFIQHTSVKKAKDTFPWQIYSEFDYRPEDHCLTKTYSNAFWKSNLDEYLKTLHVDFVMLTGFIAEYCVYATYLGAHERGYKARIIQDTIASVDDMHRIQFILGISDHISLGEIEEFLIKTRSE
jgi:nicotinamidase-related amidase